MRVPSATAINVLGGSLTLMSILWGLGKNICSTDGILSVLQLARQPTYFSLLLCHCGPPPIFMLDRHMHGIFPDTEVKGQELRKCVRATLGTLELLGWKETW